MTENTDSRHTPVLLGVPDAQVPAAALLEIMRAVADSIVGAGPAGMPAGALYSCLSSYGCNKQQYDHLMDALVDAGCIRRVGDSYFGLG